TRYPTWEYKHGHSKQTGRRRGRYTVLFLLLKSWRLFLSVWAVYEGCSSMREFVRHWRVNFGYLRCGSEHRVSFILCCTTGTRYSNCPSHHQHSYWARLTKPHHRLFRVTTTNATILLGQYLEENRRILLLGLGVS